MTVADDIAQFLQATAETPRIWQSLDVRTLAVNADGAWHNLMTRCMLDTRPLADVPVLRNLPRTEVLHCEQHVLPVARIAELLDQVSRGRLELGGPPILFLKRERQDTEQQTSYDWSYTYVARLRPDAAEHGAPSHNHVVRLQSGTAQQVFNRVPGGLELLNGVLRGLRRPWDGIDSLTRYGLETSDRIDYGANAIFEAVAPLPLSFDVEHCSLHSGVLSYAVTTTARCR